MSETEEAYKKLEKKYSIPSYKELNNEFELDDIDTSFILRNVLRKIAEKLEFYVGVIGDIMQPDTGSLSSMHETRFFSDAEKAEIYTLFKKIMKVHRGIIEQVLGKTEHEQAEFLKTFFSEWKEMKPELITIIKKMKDCWDKETTIDQQIAYFG